MKINMKQFSMEFFNAFAQCKEYLFVKRYGKNSFEVGKIGYYNHYKNSQQNKNHHMFYFGTLFNKWFCESIEVILKDGKRCPHLAIVTPKHVFWWFFKTSKDKYAFEHKRFQITRNDHVSCG